MPRRVLLALASGALLVAAFEPLAWWWVTLPSLTGLGLALSGARPRGAWLPALAFGLAFYLPHIAWMRAVATPAWLGLAGLEIAFLTLLGPLAALLSRHRLWPLWAAAAWASVETVRSTWPFSGMPWGRLAFGVIDTPVAPLLAYLGATGVGFVVALTGFSLAALVARLARPAPDGRRLARGPAIALAGLVALIASVNAAPYELPVTGSATVAAVQGGVPGPGDDILYDFRQVTQNHVDATVRLAARVAEGSVPRPDFVVWPENSTAVDPFVDAGTGAQIRQAVAAAGVPVLVGAIVDDGSEHVLNQGIVWDPETGPGERYTKRHPVPYGEFIPGRSALERLGIPVGNFGDLALIQRDMRAGTRREPLPVAGTRVADAICFDIAYDDGLYDQVTRGAELMVVQTSNATFIDTTQVDQQFAITRSRAVEAGRWLVVASTNGLSGVISPDGEVVATAPRRATAVLVEQVRLISGVTPGVRVGRWSGWGVAGLLLLGLALARPRRATAGARRGVGPEAAHPPGGTMEATEDEEGDDVAGTSTEHATTSRAGQARAVMVVPTYQEADNLAGIVARLRSTHPDVDVLVVDDASPDGTGRIADELAEHDAAVHVLHRAGKAGLGAAYLAGFRWALERDYPAVGEMDADGSHAPEQLDRLLDALGSADREGADREGADREGADLVIGSRYVRGGAVHRWPLHREVLSRGGNLYVRLLLGLPVRDATAGYRLFRREALERLDLDGVRSLGYVFQTDLAARAVQAGLRVREVPIDFVERTHGDSKMDRAVAVESLRLITRWGLAMRWAQLRTVLERGAAERPEQTVPSP